MAKKSLTKAQLAASAQAQTRTLNDIKGAVLVVSILINAFFFVGWAVLRLTSQYDASLASALLGR